MAKGRFWLIFALAALLGAGILTGVGYLYLQQALVPADKIIPGVRVMGDSFAGLTRPQALARLAARERELLARPLLFTYGQRSWLVSPRSLGIDLQAGAMVEQALKIGHSGNIWEQYQTQRRVAREGVEIAPRLSFRENLLQQQLDEIGREITEPPRDASFRVRSDDSIEIIPGRPGKKIDRDRVLADLQKDLQEGYLSRRIELVLVEAQPRVTTQQVEGYGLSGLLASFTTRFDAANADRSYNIRIAAKALDDLLLPPGETASFNQVVGPRSSEAGYKNAKVIVGNELVDGLGGGVCQVSTTLYNAALLAGLEIVRRSNHSLPVSYVAPGRDATVTYGYIDFVFRNSTPNHILVKTFTGNGSLTVKIYGNRQYRKQISVRTKILEVFPPQVVYEQDPTLPRGVQKVKQEGKPGYRVAAERVIYENGQSRVEPLPGSLYRPMNKIILIGTGKAQSTGAGSGEQAGGAAQTPPVSGEGGTPATGSTAGTDASGQGELLPPSGQ
ncbi:VanW family protein [Desulfurispora thermophila]|uniref:VanW family protein n=1 Tax=Desulfurispora thermophila TaxID=265470 RepID=UPI0012E9F155|nr:VanW family protein [Desulfurispora thermophila]